MTSQNPSIVASRLLPLIAVGIAGLAYAVWGVDHGIAALVGGGVSLANWFVLRFLVTRITTGQNQSKAGFSLLLVAKMGVLVATVFVLIHRLALEPLGLVLGLSTLFVAPVLSALVGAGSLAPSAAVAASASKER